MKEPKIFTRVLSIFKYFMGLTMVLEGITTPFLPLQETTAFGFIYNTRTGLVLFGIWFFLSGATLLYGKIRNKQKWVGVGIGNIALAYLFGFILQVVALPEDVFTWIANLVLFIIMSALYLRWRLKYNYIPPRKFARQIMEGIDEAGRHMLRSS